MKMRFTNTMTVARDQPDVFAFLTEFENVPRWNHAIHRTRKLSRGPVGVGSRYVQERTVPTRGEETFEVTEYAPDHRFAIEGTLGLFDARLTYDLEPLGATTLVTNTVDLQAKGVFRLVAPMAAAQIKAAVAENLATLKQLLA
jgi:carbon monoxide dehydrogenase subunit G